MNASRKNSGIAGSITMVILILSASTAAMATTTGITSIDSGVTTATNVLKGLAGFGALGFIGWSIWELFGHSNMKRAVVEFLVGVMFGIISVNAAAVCTAFGIGGTMIR